MDSLVEITKIITTIASVAIAISLYRLSRQQRSDTWLRLFSEIHHTFWNDPDICEIRYCLCHDNAYKPLGETISLRMEILNGSTDDKLSIEQQELLDKLDKFLNLIDRAVGTSLGAPKAKHMWRKRFFTAWIDLCINSSRTEFDCYINYFYGKFKNEAELCLKLQNRP